MKGIDPSVKAFNASIASESFLVRRLRKIVENISKFYSVAYGNLAAGITPLYYISYFVRKQNFHFLSSNTRGSSIYA